MKDLILPAVIILLLGTASCSKDTQVQEAGLCDLESAVSQIHVGMTRGRIEQILAPYRDCGRIGIAGGTGSGNRHGSPLVGGRSVWLAFSNAGSARPAGSSDDVVLTRALRVDHEDQPNRAR